MGFNPDELQMLSIRPVPSSRMSPSSMHTSVLCMDSFIKKTVEQYNMHRYDTLVHFTYKCSVVKSVV